MGCKDYLLELDIKLKPQKGELALLKNVKNVGLKV